MTNTKEEIITEYKKLRDHLGESPSMTVFFKETGIPRRHLEKIFGSNYYSKLVSECGDIPKEFFRQKSDLEDVLSQWGNLARKLNKIPTSADWAFNNCTPTVDGVTKSHNLKWTDFPYKFLEFYSADNSWSDVIAIIPNRSINGNFISKSTPKIDGLTFEILKFIPPVVHDLVEHSGNKEKALEFERGVNLVFQMLGFDVQDYGQGTGRNPDGIAKANQHGYAILIDAKSRADNYKIGTDDRTFIEYINKFSEPLKKSGFKNIYLLIVSSGFDSVSATAIKNIKIETQVVTTLLTSKLLLKILSSKIRTPRLFDLKKFQELLIEDGEVTEKRIDKFIDGMK